MRAHGVLTDIPEAGTSDHLCWVYDDEAEFDRAVGQFLAGGLERGERLLCVGERVIESLGALPVDIGPLLGSGAVQTQTLQQAYEAAGPFLPENQLAYYEAATQRALREGYRGLRVIAEVSALAEDPVTRSQLVRWEHVADGFVAEEAGFTAMCAYSGALTDQALADVAAVHPLVHAPDGVAPFQIFVDDRRIVLAGSVDTFTAERLGRVLAASTGGADGTVLDLGLLEFADVAACRTVALWAQELQGRDVPVTVVGASPLFRRMWRILSLDRLSHARFAAQAA